MLNLLDGLDVLGTLDVQDVVEILGILDVRLFSCQWFNTVTISLIISSSRFGFESNLPKIL